MKIADSDASEGLKPSIAIANTYSLIAAMYCLSSAVLFYFVVGHNFLSAVHLAGFTSVVANFLLLKVTGKFNRAS